jgi:predicted helicase
MDREAARQKFQLGEDVRDWRVEWAQSDVRKNLSPDRLIPIAYRPLDTRWTFYTGNSRGFMVYPRDDVMKHLAHHQNLALIYSRQAAQMDTGWNHALVSNAIFDNRGIYSNKGISQASPLYLYPSPDELDQSRRINFDEKVFRKIRDLAKHAARGEPDEVAVFDYVYGVLHCPAYRESYDEFLKVDFPRIPWPASPEVFWDVSDKGSQMRGLHLMESSAIGETPFPFTGAGDNVVDKAELREGAVWINKSQKFENVVPVSWDFYIGGYQPAQKWMKDRKGRALTFDDVKHYQKILKILAETDRIMQTIEMPL